MYNIGDIFYEDEEYSKRAEYCNKQGLMITEISSDSEGRRRFQIQEFALSPKVKLQNELIQLNLWFTEIYDLQIKEAERCKRLGLEYDNKHGTVEELDALAVTNSARIKEIRALLEN